MSGLCIMIAGIALLGCGDAVTYTLYRDSVVIPDARLHVATFDSADGAQYNSENCLVARDLFQQQPDSQDEVLVREGKISPVTAHANGEARGRGGLGAMTRSRDMNVTARPLRLSKTGGACRQVEEAIKALERGDFDIAVTLAGAAEGMLERSGQHMWSFTMKSPGAAAFEKTELVRFLNAERDWLKHPTPDAGNTMTLTRAHAALMIVRAMTKLETWSPRMNRFKRWYQGNLDEVLQELDPACLPADARSHENVERASSEARGGRGSGQKEYNVTEEMPSEQTDLVDVFMAPYVRPLGNLVVLFAQAEAEWLQLVIDLINCTEKEAGKFVQEEATKVKREILTRVNASGIGDGMRQELCESIENFFEDRERRNRLIHDEWYVSLVEEPLQAIPMIRGLPRKKDAEVVYGEPTPEDIWDLALRFREQGSIFKAASRTLRELPSETSDDCP
jgi:hypothetical protein